MANPSYSHLTNLIFRGSLEVVDRAKTVGYFASAEIGVLVSSNQCIDQPIHHGVGEQPAA
jgi:hypothetical protein